MDLFNYPIDKHKNWLPYDGIVNYYGQLWKKEHANLYLNKLLKTIEWRNDEVVMFGKKITTKKKDGLVWRKIFYIHILQYHKAGTGLNKRVIAIKNVNL